MSQARSSPAYPSRGPSWTRAPVITRFLYTFTGEERLNDALGTPLSTSAVFMLTEPLSPNPETGLPVFAFSAIRRPSLVPKNKAAGDWLSPAQYSRPRVDALVPPRSATQIWLPVSGSNATTLPLGVGKYIIPPATIGVVSARPPPPPPPRPRPAPAPAGTVDARLPPAS